MLQSIVECYRVFLAHLLGPIFGLVVVIAKKLALVAERIVKTLDDDVQHRVGGRHLQCLLVIEQVVHEDLHPASLKDTCFDVEVYQSVVLNEWSALAEILESTDQL